MLLIGCGGTGDGSTTGGGSGAVTVWYGSAQNIPNNLLVTPARTQSTDTLIEYRTRTGNVTLLTAYSAVDITGGAAMSKNTFTSSGFFQSVIGQDGSSGDITASGTTFLSGGGFTGSTQTVNYGYGQNSATYLSGFFMLQPIIVGAGAVSSYRAGIGCGGGEGTVIPGGSGMVLIASW